MQTQWLHPRNNARCRLLPYTEAPKCPNRMLVTPRPHFLLHWPTMPPNLACIITCHFLHCVAILCLNNSVHSSLISAPLAWTCRTSHLVNQISPTKCCKGPVDRQEERVHHHHHWWRNDQIQQLLDHCGQYRLSQYPKFPSKNWRPKTNGWGLSKT